MLHDRELDLSTDFSERPNRSLKYWKNANVFEREREPTAGKIWSKNEITKLNYDYLLPASGFLPLREQHLSWKILPA